MEATVNAIFTLLAFFMTLMKYTNGHIILLLLAFSVEHTAYTFNFLFSYLTLCILFLFAGKAAVGSVVFSVPDLLATTSNTNTENRPFSLQ